MQKREVWKVIVFGLITFGIYDVYWLYKTYKEMLRLGERIPKMRLLLLPFFVLIAIMIMQFAVHFIAATSTATLDDASPVSCMTVAETLDPNCESTDTSLSDTLQPDTTIADPSSSNTSPLVLKIVNIFSVLGGVLAFLALIPISIIWFYKYCLAVGHVTSGQTSSGMAFGLYILLSLFGLSFVWPGIIQDGFNKIGLLPSAGLGPDQTPPTTTSSNQL